MKVPFLISICALAYIPRYCTSNAVPSCVNHELPTFGTPEVTPASPADKTNPMASRSVYEWEERKEGDSRLIPDPEKRYVCVCLCVCVCVCVCVIEEEEEGGVKRMCMCVHVCPCKRLCISLTVLAMLLVMYSCICEGMQAMVPHGSQTSISVSTNTPNSGSTLFL